MEMDEILPDTGADIKQGTCISPVRIHTDFHVELAGSKTKCRICYEVDNKYTCPRCNLPYCSVTCFKSSKHAGCSESFYKDCFMQEMNSQVVTTNDKLKILKMIQDLDNDPIDEDEKQSLQRRLQGVDLDDEDDIWKNLTAEEKADFLHSVGDGTLIDEWQPWWLFHENKLIQEIDPSNTTDADTPLMMPPDVKLEVPNLSCLLPGKVPSPQIGNNLVEILYAYAYYSRRYNGYSGDFSEEFISNIIFASTFLCEGETKSTLTEALQAAMDRCHAHNKDTATRQKEIEAILDVYHILLGPREDSNSLYAKSSIAESHSHCKNMICQHDASTSHINRTLIRKVLKKLEFLHAWVDQFSLQLPILALEIWNIYNSKTTWLKSHELLESQINWPKDKTVVKDKLIVEM